MEHDACNLAKTSFQGGICRHRVFESIKYCLTSHFQHHDWIFKGKTRHDVFHAKNARRIDLIAAKGPSCRQTAVAVIEMHHEVAHEIAQIRLLKSNRCETTIERCSSIPNRLFEFAFHRG